MANVDFGANCTILFMIISPYKLSLPPNHEMPDYTEENMADALFDIIDSGLS